MKINADQLKGLLEQEQKQKSSNQKSGKAFHEMLDRALSPQTEQADAPPAQSLTGSNLNALHTQLRTSLAAETQPQEATGDQLLQGMDYVLDQWEKYSQQLQSRGSNLKQSYATLQEIGRNLEAMEDAVKERGDEGSALHPLLNELKIIAVTEEIKFNRGDYL